MSQATMLTAEPAPEIERDVDSLYEVIDGRRVEKPPMGNFQVLVASILAQLLGHHARANGLGRVVTEMLFKINPSGKKKRRPDVAFVSYERWARGRKFNSEDGWDVIPDLAIEVVSLSNSAEEVADKIAEYFRVGVLRVWAVYPITRQVYVHESTSRVAVLNLGDDLDGDDLDGGDLLPGFRLSLTELFEDGEEIETTPPHVA